MGPPASRLPRSFIAALCIGALVATLLWTDQAARRAEAREDWFGEQEAIYLPPAEALRALSLGRPQLMADALWLRAISYFGIHFLGDRDYEWLDPLIETILELDPEFRKVYHWAAVILMYGAEIDNRAVMASNRILSRALKRFPSDWEFHFLLGCNYFFELRTDNPKLKEEWRRMGADHIQSAANLSGAPAWLPLTAAAMHQRLGQQELAIHHLEEVYLRTSDAGIQAQIATQLTKLKNQHSFELLQSQKRDFEQRWKTSYPYLSDNLFALVGERFNGDVDPVWRLRPVNGSTQNRSGAEPSLKPAAP